MTIKYSVCYSFGGQFMLTFFCPVICKLHTQTGNITVQYYQPCRTLVMILFPVCCHIQKLRRYSGVTRWPVIMAAPFSSRPVCLGFVVVKIALRQDLLQLLRLSPVGIIPYPYSFMYHYCCVNVTTESIVKQDTLRIVFIATYRFVSFVHWSILLRAGQTRENSWRKINQLDLNYRYLMNFFYR